MLEERRADRGENARERLRAKGVFRRRVLRAGADRLAVAFLNTAGGHEGRSALVVATIAVAVEPIMQLRCDRERGRKGDRREGKPCRKRTQARRQGKRRRHVARILREIHERCNPQVEIAGRLQK